MNLKKIIALFLSVMFIAVCFVTPASAAEYRVAGTKGATNISDSYASSVFYKSFQKIELTGDGRIDTVAIALSQIGYQEGNDVSQFGGTYPGSNNFTEFNWNMGDYGSGYGGDYAWCASFVSFALFQARTHNYSKFSDICRNHTDDGNYIWREIGCQKWREQLDRFGYLQASRSLGGNYTPITGDLIFFGSSASHSSHIGLVVYCDGTNVYTVEGNTSQAPGLNANGGGVYFKSYALTSDRILGYGVLPYNTNDNAIMPDYSCKNLTTGIYINTNFEDSGIQKQTYRDEDCTRSGPKMEKNSMFEVLEFVSDNVAKCKFFRTNASGFTEVEGYIKFDDGAKIVQAVSYGEKYEDNTQPPVETPTTEAPTTEAPTTETPTTETPTTETPTTETPTTETPTTETPTTETPTTETPTTETPTDETPSEEIPSEEPSEEHSEETPTEEPSETVTTTVSDEPSVNAPETPTTGNAGETPKASGCGSAIGGVSAIVVAVATTCALYTKKRKRK